MQMPAINILEDFTLEKEAAVDTQKAMQNILEDFTLEKEAAVDTQKAMQNILEDFNIERLKAKTTNDDLVLVNKELDAFSYSISHDLRSPLRFVNGYAKMLDEDYASVLDAEGKRLLLIIQESAKKMGQLIDDLLTFSRLGRKEIRKSTIDMTRLVKNVLLELDKSMGYKAEIKLDALHPVEADEALIKQVFINLFSNAIKYSSKADHPLLTISSQQKQGELIYSVSDNGVGFDMQYAHKLFGVFQRLHSDEEFEGTGVGLAIVQRIISRHAGKVWAKGEINKGAAFYFSLPD